MLLNKVRVPVMVLTGNIALGKNASVQYCARCGILANTASLAVDGQSVSKDYNHPANCVIATSTSGLPSLWWMVDLGGLYTVIRVTVYGNKARSRR